MVQFEHSGYELMTHLHFTQADESGVAVHRVLVANVETNAARADVWPAQHREPTVTKRHCTLSHHTHAAAVSISVSVDEVHQFLFRDTVETVCFFYMYIVWVYGVQAYVVAGNSECQRVKHDTQETPESS